MNFIQSELGRLKDFQRVVEGEKIVERVKDTEELLKDGLKKMKEGQDKVTLYFFI